MAREGAGAVTSSSGIVSPPSGKHFVSVGEFLTENCVICRGIFDGKLCYDAQKDTLYSVI